MVLWLRWWRVRWITHFLHRFEPCRGCSKVSIYLKVEPNPCTPIESNMQGWRDLCFLANVKEENGGLLKMVLD